LTAAFVSFFATPVVIKYAKKLGIVDDPGKTLHPKVIHTTPTPRGGGIPIFLALVASSLIFLPFDKHLIGILTGALILVVMGFLDDKHNLNPYLRLVLGFVAVSAPVLSGIGIAFLSNPIGGGIINLSQPQLSFTLFESNHSIWLLSDLFALIWVTFLMNMVNMGAKGVDGQLSGVIPIAALTIAFLSLRFIGDSSQWPVIILAGITAGAYLGFLPWHIYPQKIMPGYGGAVLAGYLLGILSILSTAKVGTLMVVLGIPLIDTGYTIVRRIFSGKSPVWGDTGHLHHRLLSIGLSKAQVAVFYWILTGVLAVVAVSLNTPNKFYTMVGVGFFLGGLILWLTHRSRKIQ
jgi:UDP-GlcNAc:undecaprenyl-phosphate GlcNAc-1-phosphate transferase